MNDNEVTKMDVLCGKGPQLMKHHGNILYRDYIKEQLHNYYNATETGKHQIRVYIYKKVYRKKGFF